MNSISSTLTKNKSCKTHMFYSFSGATWGARTPDLMIKSHLEKFNYESDSYISMEFITVFITENWVCGKILTERDKGVITYVSLKFKQN